MEYKVQSTMDYSQFKNLVGNRFIREPHVRSLMESFKAFPNMAPAKPCIVNERNEMIDGQHRLEARKRLGWEFFYMVIPGLTIADARILNAYQATWHLRDYAESFSASGMKEYTQLLDIADDYPVAMRSLINYTAPGDARATEKSFKLGEYNPREKHEIIADLKKLHDYAEITPKWKEQSLALAVYSLLDNPNYDHEKMLTVLRSARITPQADRIGWLREFEIHYNNAKAPGARYVRFLK